MAALHSETGVDSQLILSEHAQKLVVSDKRRYLEKVANSKDRRSLLHTKDRIEQGRVSSCADNRYFQLSYFRNQFLHITTVQSIQKP